jgi:hypothetical protein
MRIKVGIIKQLIKENLGIDNTLAIKTKFDTNIIDFIRKARELLNLKSPDEMTETEQGIYLRIVDHMTQEMLEILLKGIQELNTLPKNEDVKEQPKPLQITH